MDQSCGLLTPVRLWRERLSARLASAVLGMSLLCAVLLTGYDFRSSAINLEAQIESMGTTLAQTIAYTCGNALATDDVPTVEDYAEYLLAQPEVLMAFVRIERPDGTVLNRDTAPTPAQVEAADAHQFTAPLLLRPQNRLLGTVTIGLDVEPWRAKLRSRALNSLLQNFLAFSLIATVLTLLLRSWLGRPLSSLDDAVQRIATGDLVVRVPITGVGELRRFARALDSMRESLRDSHASLAGQNSRLRELDRLKDEFIANTSHEIRTPLSSILGGLELLADASVADREELLDAMRRNGAHLLFLINQVLDFSKLQAGNLCIEPQDVAVRPLLEDVLGCLRPQAMAKGLVLQLRWGQGVPDRMHTDPLRLRQVLMNLVGNAIKFTAKGGVRLTAAATGEDGRRLRLTITDTGPGIAVEAQGRLFVPFAQGDASMSRRFGGTGLGLVISRQLTQLLGGEIALSSKPGLGTRLAVEVPVGEVARIAPPAATPTVNTPAATTPPGSAGRVLLVDDAADNRRLLSTMLRKAGVEVTTAEDGERGCASVADAAAHGQPFDLVLMDIQMPVLDGHGATRRLRLEGHTLPIVALTAHATEHDRAACMAAGFDAYATKPISRAQLTELVQRYVGGERR